MDKLKNKLLQMFILGYDGDTPTEKICNLLSSGLGGVILFSQNIKTFDQTIFAAEKIKSHAQITPFISIDQEGGRVERTENLFSGKNFLSAKFAAQKGDDFVVNQTKDIAKLLKTLGFNLNFAPDIDVNTNPNNPIIGERAFSNNTDEVIKFGNIVVKEYLRNGIIPCTKHFPGHGDANADSHLTLPEINLSFEDFEKNHIRAFKEVKSPMVMVAHLHCKAFDTDKIPSSMSKNVLDYLKKTLSYNPLIITDDMVMGGICQNNKPVENVINAIKNGVDLILYRGSDDKTIEIIDDVYKYVTNDFELQTRIKTSFNRIIEFKTKFLNT